MSLQTGIRCSTVALALAALGCASMQAMNERALGSPHAGGLAALRVVLTTDFRDSPDFLIASRRLMIGENRLPQASSLSADIQLQGEGKLRGGRQFAGLIVFADLRPGTYALRRLELPREILEHVEDWQVVSNGKVFRLDRGDQGITFQVRAGEPIYIGSMELDVNYTGEVLEEAKRVEFEPGAYTARFTRERDQEVQTWTRVLERASGSSWVPALKERIELLRNH